MTQDQDIITAISERTHNIEGRDKLTCSDAFELAEKFNMEIIQIGRLCNERNIKICKCQLGCFK
jgi:hypothetical protein